MVNTVFTIDHLIDRRGRLDNPCLSLSGSRIGVWHIGVLHSPVFHENMFFEAMFVFVSRGAEGAPEPRRFPTLVLLVCVQRRIVFVFPTAFAQEHF